MASNMLHTLFLLSCLPLFTSSFPPSSAISDPLSLDSSDKVPAGVYYQSLANGNAMFITDILSQIFVNGIISIVDLHLVPWGNSQILSNKTFACQGGEEECYLNTVEACAIDVWPAVGKHIEFIACIEHMFLVEKLSQWKTCFDTSIFDRKPIDECYSSGRGKELEFKYAKETEALKPPHLYTPWVVVDGKPIYEDIYNFISYICKAYKGPSPPEACKNVSSIVTPSDKEKPVQLSHREDLTEAAKFTRSKLG